MKLSYDRKTDVMYINVGNTSNSYGREDNDGIVYFYDTETEEFTGLTIFDYREKRKSGFLRNLVIPYPIDFYQRRFAR